MLDGAADFDRQFESGTLVELLVVGLERS